MITASGWRAGYFTIAGIQGGVALVVVISLIKGVWLSSKDLSIKNNENSPQPDNISEQVIETSNTTEASVREILPKKNEYQQAQSKISPLLARPRNQIVQLAIFFFHSGIDVLIGAYTVSVLVFSRNINLNTASIYAVIYFGALTAGRFIFGAFANKINNTALIRIGFFLSGIGIMLMIFFSSFAAMALIGFGFAPIFPCLMHGTQKRFESNIVTRLSGFSVAASSAGGAVMSLIAGVVLARINLEAFFPIILGMITAMLLLNEFLEWRLRSHTRKFKIGTTNNDSAARQ